MNACNQYQKNQILSASPDQILLMLYDGAVRFTRLAMHGLENDDPAIVHHGVAKTVAIITEFSNSLDHKIGGQISENLDALYSYMIRELICANLNKDPEKLKIVEKLLVDLRSTWAEAIRSQNSMKMVANQRDSKATNDAENKVEDDYVQISRSGSIRK